uniref:Uncharacterized protein n=1 Tax=Marinobacter nauticus TaxID=2743 RepID=A0A455W749_MARNT|nr:hypothetical protein YBY_02230 [Marinobacter nauticus]
MRREGRETVSLTHLRVGESGVIMRYWPGHPSESHRNDPFLASIECQPGHDNQRQTQSNKYAAGVSVFKGR